MTRPNMYEELGGEAALRPIIEEFVRLVMRDTMIGFFFRSVDPARLTEREFQFTARFLGGEMPYEGRTMRAAHAAHPIMGGQFERRRRILEQCIERHAVPAHIQAAWLEHVDKLRPQITKDGAGQCHTPEDGDRASPKPPRFGTIS